MIGPRGPEDVCLRDLFDFLTDLEKAIATLVDTEKLSEPLVSLVGVQPGHSSRLLLSVPSVANPAITTITEVAQKSRYDLLPRATHKHLHSAYNHLKKKDYTLLIHGSRKVKIARAKLSPENGVPAPVPLTVAGDTTVIGRCMKVGGVDPTVELRIEGRANPLHVRVTEEIAKKLAKCLYEKVVVKGEAKWRPDDRHIEHMRGTNVSDFKPLPLPLALEKLAEASRGRWDNVDASEYVHSLREGRENPIDGNEKQDKPVNETKRIDS